MKSKISAIKGACLLAACASQTNAETQPTYSEQAQMVAQTHAAKGFCGSVLVARDGEVVFADGYCPADRGWGVENTPDTRYFLASLTKGITAILIAQLVEDGALSLDDALADHLPDYKADYAGQVTLRQMLQHRSGIPNYIDLPGWFDGRFKAPLSDEAFLVEIAKLPLKFEPGVDRSYSNANFFLLGQVIEAVTGKAYGAFLDENLLKPAGMTSTSSFREADVLPKLARNYMHGDAGGFINGPRLNMDVFKATASVSSTVEDLYRLDRALADPDVISSDVSNLVFDPASPLAWQVAQLEGEDREHPVTLQIANGDMVGYASMMARLPDVDGAVIVLSNHQATYSEMSALVLELADVMLAASEN